MLRYYKPTVGSDHIPDRFAWVDFYAPYAIMLMAFGILLAVML